MERAEGSWHRAEGVHANAAGGVSPSPSLCTFECARNATLAFLSVGYSPLQSHPSMSQPARDLPSSSSIIRYLPPSRLPSKSAIATALRIWPSCSQMAIARFFDMSRESQMYGSLLRHQNQLSSSKIECSQASALASIGFNFLGSSA